jgi:hypothetical protein
MVLQLIRTVHKNIVVQAYRDTRHSHTTSTLQSIQMASRLRYIKSKKLIRLYLIGNDFSGSLSTVRCFYDP